MAGPAGTAEREHEPGRAAPGAPPAPPRSRRWWRLRRRTVLLSAVAAVVLGGFSGWALYGSHWLRVERVTVGWADSPPSPRELTREQVLDAAGVPVGEPMAALDAAAVRERLLDRLPRLESVDIARAWPHEVVLKVTERQAEVLVETDGGYIEVDAGGVEFARVPEAVPGVPLLVLSLDAGPSLRRFGEERVRAGAVAVAAALPEEVRRETEVIRVRSYDAIVLELTGDRTVLWGSPDQRRAKAEALVALMKAASAAGHFDVSVPSAPAASAG